MPVEDPNFKLEEVLGQPQIVSGSIRVISSSTKKARKSVKMMVKPYLTFTESEALPYTPPVLHHHISGSRNFPANITSFLASFQGDPAI